MSVRVTNIAKNTSYFTLALILQKAISLFYFTIYARVLGPADLGKYYLAISITSIFSIFIDLGLSNVLTREIAKDQSKANYWLNTALAIKIPLAFLTSAVVIAMVNIMGYPVLTRQLVYWSIICMVLDSFTAIFYACLRGFHNLKYESIASVINQLIVLIVSLIILYWGGGVRWLMISLLAGGLFNFIYSGIALRRHGQVSVKPIWQWSSWQKAILLALPFAGYAVFQRAYTYLDVVLLSKLSGDVAVGIYQIPFKIITALQFLPMAFIASLYPALSLYWRENRQQLAATYLRAMHYSAVISLPIMVGGWLVAEQLVAIFSSGYQGAVWPLRWCLMAVPFMFLSYPIGSLLNACDRQKVNTYNMLTVLIVSVVLNSFLIPGWGVTGASWTVALTNLLLVVLGLWTARSILDNSLAWLTKFGQTVLAAFLMGLIVFWLSVRAVNLFIIIALGGLVYGLALLLTGSLKWSDLTSVIGSFRRSVAK